MRSEKWIWGKILGFKAGDKVRLTQDYPISDKENSNPLKIPWGFPLKLKVIKKGTLGTIVQVLSLGDFQSYIVNFRKPSLQNYLVTDFEIEPADERDLE